MGRRPGPPGADSKFSKPEAMENLEKSRLTLGERVTTF